MDVAIACFLQVDIMLRFKANWVELPHADQAEGPGFKHFQVWR
jgi:hypothetical protein